jgi:hypothetical protein
MPSMFDRISKFARSPQGKKAMDDAKRFAQDPKRRKQLDDVRKRFGSKGGRPPAS